MASTVNKIAKVVQKQIPVIIEKSKPKLRTFAYYAKVELIPPSPAEVPQIMNGFKNIVRGAKTGAWKKLSVREAWVNTLVTVEVLCWFFVGEVIGKGHLLGYDV